MVDDTAWLRRAIFGECKRRGLSDEDRRAVQSRVTGKASMKGMSDDDMRRVLRELRGAPRSSGSRTRGPGAGEDQAAKGVSSAQGDAILPVTHRSKLRAMWICAFELGVVDNPTDGALAKWICRQTKVDHARWATPVMTASCVEALKDWMARDGNVNWKPYAQAKGRAKAIPRARVLEALWRRLHQAGAVNIPDAGALASWVTGFRRAPEDYTALPGTIQDQLIRKLGAWLREAKG